MRTLAVSTGRWRGTGPRPTGREAVSEIEETGTRNTEREADCEGQTLAPRNARWLSEIETIFLDFATQIC